MAETARRTRKSSNVLTQAAAAKSAAPSTETPIEQDVIAAPKAAKGSRRDMRPTLREEDPRARAARRAAELREHNNGDMDEGTDEFYIDPREVPPGWSYEWKRQSVYNKEDPAYQVALARKGWEPVPATRHPSFMPSGDAAATIERKGMILMERPLEITREVQANERKKARDAVRQKERQLNASPDGTFARVDQTGTPMARVGKSYEAVPIPE